MKTKFTYEQSVDIVAKMRPGPKPHNRPKRKKICVSLSLEGYRDLHLIAAHLGCSASSWIESEIQKFRFAKPNKS